MVTDNPKFCRPRITKREVEMTTELNESTQQPVDTDGSGSRQERVVSGLRFMLGITEEDASDQELLEKTKNTLSRKLVDLSIAQEDFAKAAKPEGEKLVADIKKAFKKIRLDR